MNRIIKIFKNSKAKSKVYQQWDDDIHNYHYYYDLKLFRYHFIKNIQNPIFGLKSPYWNKNNIIELPSMDIWSAKQEAEYWGHSFFRK